MTRIRSLCSLLTTLVVGGAHLPFRGLGHIRAEGKSYAWVSVDYNGLR